MITLKTLPRANKQQIFDQVAKHMLTQMQKSTVINENGDSICSYKNPEGLACAAGCLIADDEYSTKFENQTWDSLADWGHVPRRNSELIRFLQKIHDKNEPVEWENLLRELANRYKLEWNINV